MKLIKKNKSSAHTRQSEAKHPAQPGKVPKTSRKKKYSDALARKIAPVRYYYIPALPRAFTPGETVALAASIERVGQLCPISVREKAGKYYLLDGERRMRALMLLNAPDVDACLINTSLSREQFFLAAHSGAGLHPLEKAELIERAQKSGLEADALNLTQAPQLSILNRLPQRIRRLLMEIPPAQLPPVHLLCALVPLPEKDCARALKLLMDKLNDSQLYAQLLKADSDSSGIFQSLRATQLYADNRLYFNSLLDILNALERNGCAVELNKQGPEEYKIHIRPLQAGEQLHMSVQTKAV